MNICYDDIQVTHGKSVFPRVLWQNLLGFAILTLFLEEMMSSSKAYFIYPSFIVKDDCWGKQFNLNPSTQNIKPLIDASHLFL
jgi:hypothetical protein